VGEIRSVVGYNNQMEKRKFIKRLRPPQQPKKVDQGSKGDKLCEKEFIPRRGNSERGG